MHPLRRLFALAGTLLALGALSTTAARAQTHPAGAWLDLHAGMRATSFLGEASAMSGGTLLLHPHSRLAVGGGGWLLLGVRRIDPDSPGGGLRLRVAYGGMTTAVGVARVGPVDTDLRVLVGVGNAKIELPVEEAQIAVDNFLVVEPEVGASLSLVGRLGARAAVGYRAVAGVEDLSGVTGSQLRGLSATLSLTVRPW